MPKFLIVDDEIVNTLLLEKIVDGFGECITCNSGKEALDVIQTNAAAGESFDIIFLDIMMPELDGHELLQQLRKIELKFSLSKAIVFMVSALDKADTILQSFAYDCQEYIVKPVRKSGIIDKLKKYGFYPSSKIPDESWKLNIG